MILMRRYRTINMRPAVWLSAIMSIALTLPFASPLAVSTIDFGVLFAFGVFEMGLGLILFTAGAQRVPPVEAAMIAILESILSPFWVWLFLGEDPGTRTILGGVIVIVAVAAHTIGDLRPARATKRPPVNASGAAAPPADR